MGVDGLSLPLLALTAVLFLAVAVYSLRETRRVKSYVCLFLFLQAVCLGLFTALDLILFFVYFDLSIVGMYFVIAGWGHGERARAAALKFFLYTFTGSLALLLGFIGLYLAVRPHTFDMVTLIRANPLAGRGVYGGLVLLAVAVGLAIKTPVVPFHTWLPPAHTEAPAAGSAILAGVLLKMGTYGFVRIAMPMLPGTWRQYAARLRRRRGRLGGLRGAGRARAGQLQADDRLHQRQPHGLHPARRRRRRDPRQRQRAGPLARGHRRGDPDGQPRAAHRRAVPAVRRPVRPGRHLRHGRLLRPGRPGTRCSPG